MLQSSTQHVIVFRYIAQSIKTQSTACLENASENLLTELVISINSNYKTFYTCFNVVQSLFDEVELTNSSENILLTLFLIKINLK